MKIKYVYNKIMIDWIIFKTASVKARCGERYFYNMCEHEWEVIETWKDMDELGMICYVTYKKCRKCGLEVEDVVYP